VVWPDVSAWAVVIGVVDDADFQPLQASAPEETNRAAANARVVAVRVMVKPPEIAKEAGFSPVSARH